MALRKLTLSRKLLLAAAGIAAVACPGMPAQVQTSTELKFEVASIKPSDPNARGMRLANTPGNGLRTTGVTLKTLIEFAYDVQDFQLSGGPGLLRTERYDIVAKAERPEGPSDSRAA